MSDVIDSTAVDDTQQPDQHDAPAAPAAGRELATRQTSGHLAVAPDAEAGQLVTRLAVIKDAMTTAMTDGIDYGKIPGVSKPTLLKPGAEKLGVLFQLDVQIENAKSWGPGDHLTVESKATVYHAPTGVRLASGEGACSTREKKYGKRQQSRTCPACGVAAIIKGKAEYGGGWVCFKKKDGCGAKYPDNAPEIVGQETGEIENPDLADTWNTVIKMAAKRARVDAILAATGASALFTQDAEDLGPVAADVGETTPAPAELPDWARPATVVQLEQAFTAATSLLGEHDGPAMVKGIQQRCGGELPALAVMILRPLAKRMIPAAGAQGTLEPEPAAPPVRASGSVPYPDIANVPDPAQKVRIMQAAGCICDRPIASIINAPVETFKDDCPIQGHGIPF